ERVFRGLVEQFREFGAFWPLPKDVVPRLDKRPAGFEDHRKVFGTFKGVAVEQLQQRKQVLIMVVDGRRAEQEQVLRDPASEFSKFVRPRLGVAQVMRLVYHEQVDEGLVMFARVQKSSEFAATRRRWLLAPIAHWSRALQAANRGKTARSRLGVLQQSQQPVGVDDVRLGAYFLAKFPLPFFTEHGGTECHQPPQIETTL